MDTTTTVEDTILTEHTVTTVTADMVKIDLKMCHNISLCNI